MAVSSNFKGVVSGNGRTLLYMDELPFYNAVYWSQYKNNGWSAPINITPQIQSDGDQYVTSVSYDGTRLYLTKEDAFNSDIYLSEFRDGKWSKSYPLEGQGINTKFWESHASISKDGKTLYFTSNRKDGIGQMDIYVAKLQADGRWGIPVNLGPVINTPLNEDTPFITENDSTLYFSSQGYENMGGYDIFVSKLDAAGHWTAPKNLGYPVNTTDDDLFFYPWNNAQIGYVSRIMDNGFGKEDLYAVQYINDRPLQEVIARFFEQHEKPQGKEVAAAVPAEKPEEKPVTTVKPEEPEITKPVEPAVTARPADELQTQAPVTPKEIELDPVYFAFDHFLLSDAGKKQLDKICQLLTDYPVVKVRLIGHADAKGPAEYNLKLSEKRALAAKNYIIAKGVDAARIETLGMGEKNFAAINSNPDGSDNPEGRQLNRRVEYEIIGTGDHVILIKMTPVPEKLKFRE